MTLLKALLAGILLGQAPALSPGRDRGIYVFGELLLDFQLRLERRSGESALVNCSSDAQFCVDGGIVNFVVPRHCQAVRVGERWRLGELETEVLGTATLDPGAHGRALGMAAQTGFYLRTNARPDVVLLYAPAHGIVRIFHDPRRQTDFAAMAVSGRLDAFYDEAIRDPTRQHMVLHLITLDPLAQCVRPAAAR